MPDPNPASNREEIDRLASTVSAHGRDLERLRNVPRQIEHLAVAVETISLKLGESANGETLVDRFDTVATDHERLTFWLKIVGGFSTAAIGIGAVVGPIVAVYVSQQ